MINTRLLKSHFVKCGKTQDQVARLMGISHQTLSGKVNNKVPFNVDEVSALCRILNIDEDKDAIFFARKID